MRLLRLLPVLACLAVAQFRSTAQCDFRPAECPVPGADQYGSSDDSISRLGNPVLPREITMENRLRRWTADLMDRMTKKEHWRYTELSEDVSSGARADDESVLAYPLRPPHWMVIHYEVIINDDSLAAWMNWLTTFAQRRLDATMEYAKQQTSGAATSASMAANSKAAEKQDKDFEDERRRMAIHYHDASLIFVEFEFNIDYVKFFGAPPATLAPPAMSGTATVWFNNPNPVFNGVELSERCHSSAVLFAGDFKRLPDGQSYQPVWRANKAATNFSTPKTIKSDQIQSVDCHFSGNMPAIRKALADLPPQELSALIARP